MVTNCKCSFGVEDPKAVVRKELAAGYDQYCKDAFSQGLSAMAWQEWMIDRLIEARKSSNHELVKSGLLAVEHVHLFEENQELKAKNEQLRDTFRAQERTIAGLHERIEKMRNGPVDLRDCSFVAVSAIQKDEPVTISSMDPLNIDHWRRRAERAEADQAEEIEARLNMQNRAEKAEAKAAELENRVGEYKARFEAQTRRVSQEIETNQHQAQAIHLLRERLDERLRIIQELERRLNEIAGIANR
jgi:hypothetical protein